MKNARRCLIAAWALLAACGAQAQWQAPIALEGRGPFHRLDLPIAIHGLTAFDDLRDLRVRNAAGQVVPWAWLDGASEEIDRTTHSVRGSLFALPLAPVGRPEGRGDEDLVLKLRADGVLAFDAAGGTASAKAKTGPAQWIVDAGKSTGSLMRARFELAAGPMGLFPFTLEASDDLRRWRSIEDDGQFVRLQHGGERIEQTSVELDRIEARFLRLRWTRPEQAPRLTGVWIDSLEQAVRQAVPRLAWTGAVPPSVCEDDHCDYPVPRGLPLHNLRIVLNQPNTLAPLRILSVHPVAAPAASQTARKHGVLSALRHGRRHEPRDGVPGSAVAADERPGANARADRVLVETTVFRFDTPSGEARSGAIALDGQAHDVLRLRSRGPIAALGAVPPTLSYGSRPRTLVFLAQGQPPFALSWNADVKAAIPAPDALPLAQLVPLSGEGQGPGIDTAHVTLTTGPSDRRAAVVQANAVAVGGQVATEPVEQPGSDRSANRSWLWGVLGVGVLLLGAMAWSLLRSVGRTSSSADSPESTPAPR